MAKRESKVGNKFMSGIKDGIAKLVSKTASKRGKSRVIGLNIGKQNIVGCEIMIQNKNI